MGKTQKEWENWMETLTPKHLSDINKACETLMDFGFIKQEYAWTGIGIIGTLAKREILNREIEQEDKAIAQMENIPNTVGMGGDEW